MSSNKIYAFLDTAIIGPDNSSISELSKQKFMDVAQTALVDNTAPSSWFTAAGGVSLVLLAAMQSLEHWRGIYPLFAAHTSPSSKDHRRSKSFLLQIMGKLLVGLILISLTALGNHKTQVELNSDYRFVGSRIWKLAIESWL